MDMNLIAARGLESLNSRQTPDASANSAEPHTTTTSASALQNIVSISQVSASAEVEAFGDNIDISEFAKSMLNGFKDMPISDSVKNFIQSQFSNFERAVGGSVDMFKASVGITTAQMKMEDGSMVDYLKVNIEMFAVSVQTLSDKVETPNQADFLRQQFDAALEFATQQMNEAMEQIEKTTDDGMIEMIEAALEQMKEALKEATENRSELQPENSEDIN